MFYRITDTIQPIDWKEMDDNAITVGYVSSEELQSFGLDFGFSHSSLEACRTASGHFRSGVAVYDEYTFTELRVVDKTNPEKYDCVALYIKKNLIIVVDVEDYDFSTKNKFMSAMERYPAANVTVEKIVYAFLEALIANDFKYIEDKGNELTALEEEVLKDNVDEDFSMNLLHLKKELLTMHNYYEQLLDITEALEENENDIFDSEDLRYIANVANKIIRLREDADSLSSSVNHLQDAYSSFLDSKLNQTMKRFTVITSIFFPLTLIAGWYGMNFKNMPEVDWRFGYLYVILLSALVVGVLMFIGRKRKWF